MIYFGIIGKIYFGKCEGLYKSPSPKKMQAGIFPEEMIIIIIIIMELLESNSFKRTYVM